MTSVAEAPRAATRTSSVITMSFKDKAALHAAYMPYVTNGALFAASTRLASLGDDVFMLVTLLDDPTRIAIQGKVVWITPAGSPGRPQGLGIQFNPTEATTQARSRIETLIGAALKSARPSYTI